jgi:hypothetical protein
LKDKIGLRKLIIHDGNHRGDRQSFYNEIHMDSNWEVLTAAYLDSKGISWEYGKKIFILDAKRSYRPDFILGDGTVIEVKGYWREANKVKFQEWQKKYPDVKFEVWDKNKLKELKII